MLSPIGRSPPLQFTTGSPVGCGSPDISSGTVGGTRRRTRRGRGPPKSRRLIVRSSGSLASCTGSWKDIAWRSRLALATLSVATLVKLVPPAATKLVIDHVLLGRPLPRGIPGWMPVPPDPKARLVLLVAGVLVVSLLGTAVGLWGRWQATRTTKRVQVAMRRRVFEHAARLPLHRVYQLKSGGAASLLREDAGGVGELVFSMLYNPWRAVVQLAGGLVVLAWVDWRLLLGSLCLLPGVYGSERLWNRWLRPLYRDVRKQRQEIDARTAEAFGGMRVVRAFGRQRREALAVRRRERLPGPPGALRLVVVADRRGRSGTCCCRPPRGRCCSTAGSGCSTAGSRSAT